MMSLLCRFFALALLTFVLVPFLLLSLYNIPAGDDFCRNSISSIPQYFLHVKEWYTLHNGRYFNAFISLLPVWYYSFMYKIQFYIFSIFFIFSIYKLIRSLFPHLVKIDSVVSSLFVFSFYIVTVPDVSSSFYWLAALSAYLFSYSIYFLLLALLAKILSKNKKIKNKNLFYVLLLIFIGVGDHEVTMVIINLTLLLLLVNNFFNSTKHRFHLIFFTFFALCCSLFVILSPGTENRKSDYVNSGGQIVNTLEKSFFSTFNFVEQTVIGDFSFMIFSLIILCLFTALMYRSKPLFKFNLCFSLLVVYVFVFAVMFVYAWSIGLPPNYGGNSRHTNIVYYYFLIGWIGFLYNLSAHIYLKFKAVKRISIDTVSLFLIVLFTLFIQKDNYREAIDDIKHKKAQLYQFYLNSRLEYIDKLKFQEGTVYLPKYSGDFPNSLQQTILKSDSNSWQNGCYKNYFNIGKSVALNDSLFLDQISKDGNYFKSLKEFRVYYKPKRSENEKPNLLEMTILSGLKKQLLLYKELEENSANFSTYKILIFPFDKDVLRNEINLKGYEFKDFTFEFNAKSKIVYLPDYKINHLLLQKIDQTGALKWEEKILFSSDQKTIQ